METIDFNTVIAENISVVEGLLPEVTLSKKGLSSTKQYSINQSKVVPSNSDTSYYFIADLRENASIVLEANGCQGTSIYSTRLYALRTTTSGLNCKQLNFSENQNSISFYHDGISKLYLCRKSYYIGTIRVIDATHNVELLLQQVDNVDGLQKVGL